MEEEELRLDTLPCRYQPRKRMVFLGPPGAGKWTIAERLRKQFCWCHLDATRYRPGENVDEEIRTDLKSYKCSRGAVIHDYPLTYEDAERLSKIAIEEKSDFDVVVELDLSSESLQKQRVLDRLMHEGSGRRYHPRLNPPKEKDRDDVTGDWLVQRLVDNEYDLLSLTRTYYSNIGRIRGFYEQKNRLRTLKVDEKSLEEVWKEVQSALFV